MATAVIGITGKKRSGKDTFAAHLIENHGYTQVRFADPLRAVAKAINPIVGCYGTRETYRLTDALGPEDDWEVAKELPEVRRLLQVIGTEAGRDILGENVWVDAAERVIDSIPGPVVVTDVRFWNEVDLIADLGTLVRVTRPSLGTPTDQHPSETALDDLVMPTDFDVVNDGTIADLHAHAERIARSPEVTWRFRV